ncbi:Dynein heavy chain 9, axonemal [Acipenser ruthenus]|uniref:Dynein heavy chain 9, axonemal n=1 Tax=Acipenser ruthenus TaxID=7906 RepID=A0A444U8N3_ACIRT|nr:Dynein heavy chain 9, axonemal [Acipenser ruthenus]
MERALSDGKVVLIENLEESVDPVLGPLLGHETIKKGRTLSCAVSFQVKEVNVTEVKIDEAREHCRPAAARASLLYFIMNDLNKIHSMYQFSLKVFGVAVLKAPSDDTLKQRVSNLIDSITFSVFQYTTRGLFEYDKLTYTAQLTFQILLMNKEINAVELDFLLRYPAQSGLSSPVDFLSVQSWGGIKRRACILENSIKITNEPPTGMHANLHKALDNFNQVKAVLDDIMEKLLDDVNIPELMGKVEERTPYIVVAIQECEHMNMLTREIKRSFREGELTMTSDMENLQNAIFLDQVPESWTKRAYPSMAGLAGWFVNLFSRIKELEPGPQTLLSHPQCGS